jgi:large repetitive protein
VIQTASLPDATATVLYSTQLASNVPSGQANWQVSAGTLPPGLTLNTGTGVISGVPVALGVYNFSVVVSTESQYGTCRHRRAR